MSDHTTPDDQALDALIDAAKALAGTTVPAAQRDTVRLHLANSLAIAEGIGPVEPEAAPVFRA